MSTRSHGRAYLVILACLSAFAAGCVAAAPAPAAAPAGPTGVLAPRPTTTKATTPHSAVGASSCKVAQVYGSSTNEPGWSWAHEQALLAAQQELLPGADLSLRMDGVPDDNAQAVEDLIESMV